MSSGPSLGWPRGGLVGAVVGLLGVAAHGAAGGGYPDTAELALLLMVSAAVGGAGGARGPNAPAPGAGAGEDAQGGYRRTLGGPK